MGEMILLGAGASKEAGIPMSRELAAEIVRRFEQRCAAVPFPERNRRMREHDPDPSDLYLQILYFTIAGLQMELAFAGANPLAAQIDVERLFSAVKMLEERKTLEVAPFVERWHQKLDDFDRPGVPYARFRESLIDAIAPAVAAELRRRPPAAGLPQAGEIRTAVRRLAELEVDDSFLVRDPGQILLDAVLSAVCQQLEHPRGARPPRAEGAGTAAAALDRAVGELVRSQRARPPDGTIFGELAAEMIRSLVQLVWRTDPGDVRYLAPLVRYAAAAPDRRPIATLNYDNTVELACTVLGERHSTAIDEWSKSGRIQWKEGAVRILKLHGSIDWEIQREARPLPRALVRQVEPERLQSDGFAPGIVFGERNKLTPEGPFLALLGAFAAELDRADTLTVAGYSFRDEHVNVQIANWLHGKADSKLRIVDPWFGTSSVPFAAALRDFAASDPSRVVNVETTAGEAFASLF